MNTFMFLVFKYFGYITGRNIIISYGSFKCVVFFGIFLFLFVSKVGIFLLCRLVTISNNKQFWKFKISGESKT